MNFIKINGFLKTTYLYADKYEDGYNIDKCIDPYLFRRIKFKHDWTHAGWDFRLCTVKVWKKDEALFEECMRKLHFAMSTKYGKSYSEFLKNSIDSIETILATITENQQ